MAVMMSKLYAALRQANGVPDPDARAAAEEAAEMHADTTDIKGTLRLHGWILTFNTAMLIAILARLFLVH